MKHPVEQMTRRLKIIQGQVAGIIKMIEKEQPDCVQVLTQMKAIKSGFTPLEEILVKASLKKCALSTNEKGESEFDEENFDKIISMFGKK